MKIRWLILVLGFVMSGISYSQEPSDGTAPGPSPSSAPQLSDAQLDKMLAPIALYPDPLLAQILPASTKPEDVVNASLIRIPTIVIISLLLLLPCRTRAVDERRFASPEEAVRTLAAAVRAKDKDTLRSIFGPSLADLRSGDEVQDATDFKSFANKLAYRAEVSLESDTNGILEAGPDAWPFPVPLVKQNGQWFFDTAAGKEEILNRRIGRNELNTIDACRAYVDAQREYAASNNDDIFEYAKNIRSGPGTKNGLYWESKPGESLSPLGPLFAAARTEGYSSKNDHNGGQPSPYHGYYFKILTRQGAHAPGGKYDYVINGHLVGGFALVAWPVEWGNSGVMTFVVNQRGKVYQKDLGSNTSSMAAAMTEFDPDKTWTASQE